MGIRIDLHSYDYEPLVEGIKAFVETEDAEVITKILGACGSVIGDKYIILHNELWEGNSPWENAAGALEHYFGAEDVLGEVFCTFDHRFGRKELINACDSPEEILEQLGLVTE